MKEWTVREYINGRPIEEYTEEEKKAFFKRALDRAFKNVGYVPVKRHKNWYSIYIKKYKR